MLSRTFGQSVRNRARAAAALIALVAWVAILASTAATIFKFGGVGAASIQLSLYFTMWTDLSVAVAMTGLALGSPRFGAPFLRGQAAIMSFTLLILYFGETSLAAFLHDDVRRQVAHAVPMLMLLHWFAFPVAGVWRRYALLWPALPIAYLVHVLLIGALLENYPYLQLDVRRIGYAAILRRAVKITLLLLGAGGLLVEINRLVLRVGRRLRSAPAVGEEAAAA